jgi:site-specific DNA-cytosine methylase
MKVLSLFNGMNTGRQALENIGIKVEKYYSSEIKPYAIELTQHHFPDGYTSILTTAKAGSLLGDGWTLPIIEHIFSFIQK